MIEYKNNDLLEATEDYICHQCNCVTNNPKGLATLIFERFPEADIYTTRTKPDNPGKIIVRGKVINMLAQRYPGKPRYQNDTKIDRINWFKQCLKQIGELNNITNVAFPFRIGCGLAGGDWDHYSKELEKFANRFPNIKCVIYKQN